MRFFRGPLGPLSIAMTAVLFVLMGSSPADAEDPDRGERPDPAPTAPAPRAAAVARYARPTPSNAFNVIVDDAVALAGQLARADQVAADIAATRAQLDELTDARRST